MLLQIKRICGRNALSMDLLRMRRWVRRDCRTATTEPRRICTCMISHLIGIYFKICHQIWPPARSLAAWESQVQLLQAEAPPNSIFIWNQNTSSTLASKRKQRAETEKKKRSYESLRREAFRPSRLLQMTKVSSQARGRSRMPWRHRLIRRGWDNPNINTCWEARPNVEKSKTKKAQKLRRSSSPAPPFNSNFSLMPASDRSPNKKNLLQRWAWALRSLRRRRRSLSSICQVLPLHKKSSTKRRKE